MRALSCVVFLWGVAACGGSSSPIQGTEGGPCFPDGACNDDLVCLSGLCVDPESCTPGDLDVCACSPTELGVSTCDSDGDWGPCECLEDCGDGTCSGDEDHANCPQDCGPETCGNGSLDSGESCDGSDLDDETCVELGFVSGTLACTTNCQFDTSGCSDVEPVLFEGIVWSPGADDPATPESNRFPVPAALVMAEGAPAALPPNGVHCNDCAQVQPTGPYTLSHVQTGQFSLALEAGASYWLTIRKGGFQRSLLLDVPNTPGESFSLEDPVATIPRPPETTLPHATDLVVGDHIPRMALLDPMYETPDPLFTALGFAESADFVFIEEQEIPTLLEDATALATYDIILAFSAETYPLGPTSTPNLRAWVQAGGTLFADDFAADYVEQPWPEFLTWYNNGVCGDGPTPPATVGECNFWDSSYSFVGAAVPPDFAAWLNLPEVNGGASLVFDDAWNIIQGVDPGVIGEDINGDPVLAEPEVWIANTESTPAGTGLPAVVSWPFYCGRVIYSLPITVDAPTNPYVLSLQEKVFLYLLLGADGC